MNLVDNSLVPKIGQVSYTLNEPLDCFTLANRPQVMLDDHFESLMKRRQSKFHVKTIDRTQYDTELLQK